jgi:hypothetical protein
VIDGQQDDSGGVVADDLRDPYSNRAEHAAVLVGMRVQDSAFARKSGRERALQERVDHHHDPETGLAD